MTGERKTEPPLKLDMDFSEALERFVRAKPKEVAESVEKSKAKKPPGDNVPRRPERTERQIALPSRQRKPSKS